MNKGETIIVQYDGHLIELVLVYFNHSEKLWLTAVKHIDYAFPKGFEQYTDGTNGRVIFGAIREVLKNEVNLYRFKWIKDEALKWSRAIHQKTLDELIFKLGEEIR